MSLLLCLSNTYLTKLVADYVVQSFDLFHWLAVNGRITPLVAYLKLNFGNLIISVSLILTSVS